MHTTIKVPFSCGDDGFLDYIKDATRAQAIVMRASYNMLRDGLSYIEIYNKIKKYNNLEIIDTYGIQAGIVRAKSFLQENGLVENVMFGGKKNWKDYNSKKIDKEQFKKKRNGNLMFGGQVESRGNKKFDFQNLINSRVLFKPKRRLKYTLEIPKLKGDYLVQMERLIKILENEATPVTISINECYIFFSFKRIENEVRPKIKNNRIFGIDQNPNSIGWSVLEFDKDDNHRIIASGVFDLYGLLNCSGNKRQHETHHLSKALINKAIHYKCSIFSIEDLTVESKDHRLGRVVNRVRNKWIRTTLLNGIEKRCYLYGIRLEKVNAAYSSFVGNLCNQDYPDPIAPAIEIARRAYKKFSRGWFYPKLINSNDLPHLWKEKVSTNYKSWVELYESCKKVGLKYHFKDQVNPCLRHKSYNSCILIKDYTGNNV